jgi:SAM-dependent methyltransferase
MQKQAVCEHYNAIAGVYGHRYEGLSGLYFQAMEDECIFRLAEFSGRFVLDAGTGTGRFAFALLRSAHAARVVGIDIAERSVAIASSSRREGENIEFRVMDAEHTAFPDRLFDSVVVLGLFEYVTDLLPYFNEAARILKPSGELVFSCWNIDRWFGWRIFNDRMEGSRDHSLDGLRKALHNAHLTLVDFVTTFFVPTRVFFGIHRRLGGSPFLQHLHLRATVGIERALRKSPLKRKGGELIVKARKAS